MNNLLKIATMVLGLGMSSQVLADHRENLRETESLVREGMEAAHDWSFTYAKYKFRAAKLRAEDVPYSAGKSQLNEALETTIEKLSDWRLSSREKEQVAQDCGRVALSAIERILHQNDGPSFEPGLRGALRQIKMVVKLAQEYRFDSSFEILERIEASLRPYRYDRDIERASQALTVIQDKVSDPRMSGREKIDVVVDCARVFEDAVLQSDSYRREVGQDDDQVYIPEPKNLDEVIALVDRAAQSASQRRFEISEQMLEVAQRRLQRYGYDRLLNDASQLLRSAVDKLNDSRASDYEKSDCLRDVASRFSAIVKRSETFRREHGIDYSQAIFIPLGMTELFSKSKLETRIVTTPSLVSSMRALRLTARDDSVSVTSVTVVLKNGGRMEIPCNFALGENSSTIIDIAMSSVAVKSIEVTGSSANIFGTKGRIQIEAVTFKEGRY